MINLAISASLALVLCSGAWGCSSDSDEAPAPQNVDPVEEKEFIDRYVAAFCGNLESCCQDSGYAFDENWCRSSFTSALQAELPRSDQHAVVFDEKAAGRCVEAAMRQSLTCGVEDNVDEACESVYKGTSAAGDACEFHLECDAPPGGGASCRNMDSDGVGVCEILYRGKEGDPCRMTVEGDESTASSSMQGTAICYKEDGLYCSEETGCSAVNQIGRSCDYDTCAIGAYCDSGACEARKGVGEACSDSWACVDGLVCMPDGTCGAPKPAGAACTESTECEYECDNGVCVSEAFVSAPMCSGTRAFQRGRIEPLRTVATAWRL